MKRYLLLSTLLFACGERPAAWSEDFAVTSPVGLNDSVAVMDTALNQVMLLSSPSPLALETRVVPVGRNVATMKASPDGQRLLVLSRGVQPRIHDEDERPRLTVIDTEGGARVTREYQLSDPLSGIVLDPELEWAVLYASAEDSRLVSNPNEVLLVHLSHPEEEPQPLTIQSRGSSPRGFVFTSTLEVPNGEPRRLLVVQTEREVTLVDLSQRDQQLAETQVTQGGLAHPPAQAVFHDRDVVIDPDDGSEYTLDPQLAVRLEGDSNVLLLELADPGGGDRPFRLEANLVDVGGTPSSIDFVRTDHGVRLVALAGGAASLVETRTSNVTPVTLSKQFTQIARVTDDLDSSAGADIALLWSANVNSLGLWNLGASTTTASRGLNTLEIGTGVKGVRDIPGDAYPTVKVIEGQSGNFWVLDLATRESSPMVTNGSQVSLSFAPDGQRLWAFLPGDHELTSINLGDLHPVTVTAQRPIQGVHDIATATGGRSALAVHEVGGTLGVTLFNALAPDGAETRFYGGLIYGGLIHD
ncbi:MAG TPA: hypothetical protein VGK73_09475 [Polyangiaceae bacterium]